MSSDQLFSCTGDAAWLVAVAMLWGGTNPLLKHFSQGVENIKCDGRIRQFLAESSFLFLNWKVSILSGCYLSGNAVIAQYVLYEYHITT